MKENDFSWKKPVGFAVIVFIAFLFGFGWGYKAGNKVTPPEKIDNPFEEVKSTPTEEDKIDNPFEIK